MGVDMGPVNWLAVVLAAAVAVALQVGWRALLMRSARPPLENLFALVVFMVLGAAMLGHSLARIGGDTLAAKPWLYFMQTGGIAIAFIIPAVWLTHARQGADARYRMLDCACWLAAFLAMGAVFWALG
jgi:hypothetical protein